MTTIESLLSQTQHRPFPYPKSEWVYYQEWNRALFLHWKVPIPALRGLVPKQLNIDLYQGEAYVSIVAFTMNNIHPRGLPAFPPVSNFNEINVRTYIENDAKKGVYFLSIEAGKSLSAYLARCLSGLPYEKAKMVRTAHHYKSVNLKKSCYLDAEYVLRDQLNSKTARDKWLTERYCLYLDKNESLYRYDIHHRPWMLRKVQLNQLDLNYNMGGLHFTSHPDYVHYSDGVKVMAWHKTKI